MLRWLKYMLVLFVLLVGTLLGQRLESQGQAAVQVEVVARDLEIPWAANLLLIAVSS